jgi:hypothetical protein
MYTDDSLKEMPFNVLLELFRKSAESVVIAKINKEDEATVALYQGILEQVQKAILSKQNHLQYLKQ